MPLCEWKSHRILKACGEDYRFHLQETLLLGTDECQETSATIARVQAGSGTVPPINVALNKSARLGPTWWASLRLLFYAVPHFSQFPRDHRTTLWWPVPFCAEFA